MTILPPGLVTRSASRSVSRSLVTCSITSLSKMPSKTLSAKGSVSPTPTTEAVDALARPVVAAAGVDVHAVSVVGEVAEAPHVGAEAAADVEHARAFERHVATQHLQAPLLAEAPDVAWVAQDYLVEADAGVLVGLIGSHGWLGQARFSAAHREPCYQSSRRPRSAKRPESDGSAS